MRGGVLVIGGVDAADASTSSVSEISAGGRSVPSAGSLAAPLHDAAAATLGGKTFVFGGGAATTIDSVEMLSASGQSQVVGALPGTRSDLSAVTVGSRVLILGGFDGTTTVGQVLETGDGHTFRDVGSLAVPVRYGAVAAVGQTIYVLGGELADGGDTSAIQAVDAQSGNAKVIGHLPRALSHASAVALGGRVYVLGGRVGGVNGKAVDQVLSFDPLTNRVRAAGHLPMPVTNATAAVTGAIGYLAGGIGSSGAPLRSVITLRLEAGGKPQG